MDRANLMVTRRCNLKCSGCGVINHTYTDMTSEEIFDAVDRLRACGVKFVQLYGGEPTMRDDLPEIIDSINRLDIAYTVVTNSVRLLADDSYLKQFMVAKPKAITCSIGANWKVGGLTLIDRLKNSNYTGEVVATIMVNRNTIGIIKDILKYLKNMGVKAVLMFLHEGDKSHWRYRGKIDPARPKLTRIEVHELAKWILLNYDNLSVMNSKSYIQAWNKYALNTMWRCSGLTSLQVNNDGRLSVCQDQPPMAFTVWDLPDHLDDIVKACDNQAKFCNGCFYDCYFEHDEKGRLLNT